MALLVAAIGIAVVVVVGPGEDKPVETVAPARASSSKPTPIRAGDREPAQPAPHARLGATVRMRDLAFHPTSVTVKVGRAVRWVNNDDVAHTVVEDLGARSGVAPLFESKRIPPGGSFRIVLTTRGTVPYVCTLHPTVMSGRIVVKR